MKILRKLRSGLGYMWAVLCFFVILGTFFGLGFWERTLTKATGIQISPRLSGGEVTQIIDHGSYKTLLHRMVFDGLIRERADGFVQVDWVPQEKRALPAMIEEALDINGDTKTELTVRLDTAARSVQLVRKQPWVLDPEPIIVSGSERILRIRLRNPARAEPRPE